MTDSPAAVLKETIAHGASVSTNGNDTYWLTFSLVFTVIFQLSAYIIAFVLETDKLTDLAGTFNFGFLALFIFVGNFSAHESGYPLVRTLILTVAVVLWALRLGSYTLWRVWTRGGDSRFESVRKTWWMLLAFWGGQMAWVWFVSLPCTIANSFSAENAQFARTDRIGLICFVAGLATETAADWQKAKFITTPKAARDLPFITTGLWRFSRHPNYFGEFLVWLGLWLFSLRTCPKYYGLLAGASPLLTHMLLVFVSGIPIAEKLDERRYRRLVVYNQYKLITSPLIPLPPRVYAKLPLPIKYWLFFDRHNPIVQRPIRRRRVRRESADGDATDNTAPTSSPMM